MRGALWLVLMLGLCAGACTKSETVFAPTQIMLRISADPVLREQLTELHVRVALREGNGFKAPVTKRFLKADLVWPVDIPILPRVPDDAFKEFEVVVDARDATGVLAQARTLSGFLPEERRVLPISLFLCPGSEVVCGDPECSGEQCEVCQSDGRCVPVDHVDPSGLAPLDDDERPDAGEPEDDAGARRDASPPGRDAAEEAGDDRDATPSDAGDSAMDGAGSAAADGRAPEAAVEAGSEAGADGGPTPSFVPVCFSDTDRRADYVALSSDRLQVENRGLEPGNVRSNLALQPGSGVFYFEAERLIDAIGAYGVGLATGAASLQEPLGYAGASLGLNTDGSFVGTGTSCTDLAAIPAAGQRQYGFVIDYRAATARIHMLLANSQGAVVACSFSSAWSVPLYLFYAGSRYEVGPQIAINTGSDTTNFPFHFSLVTVRAALEASQEHDAAAALVPGFGQTRALPASQLPSLTRPADRSVVAGTQLVLSGTASDAEDGDLTSKITWRDLSSLHHAPLTGAGASFSFTPGLGRHPIQMSVTDSVGLTRSEVVMVEATGSLPLANPPRLVRDAALSDPSVNLSGDGLRVDFRALSAEAGLKANQAIYGSYWYFEAERLFAAPASISLGVMVGEGALNPLDFEDIPWCASLFMGGVSAYNMNSVDNWDAQNNHYGVAVDYRGQHPLVHIMVGGAAGNASGRHEVTIEMKDVWTPVYPFISGVWLDDDTAYDAALNFGAAPFVFDPSVLLGDRADGIKLGWGMYAPP